MSVGIEFGIYFMRPFSNLSLYKFLSLFDIRMFARSPPSRLAAWLSVRLVISLFGGFVLKPDK